MAERTRHTPAMDVSVAGSRPITAADVRAPGAARKPLRKVVAHPPGPWWNTLILERLRALAANTWVTRITS